MEPCACGNRGCWEKYASETSVLLNILAAEPGDASDVEWISRRIAEGDDLQRIHNQLYSQISHYREISLSGIGRKS
ncbi:ROK family protein [Paenibacillus sp. VCA1]|uniref:ROK family protein n=1 Tax=Paenibacillus sp. VCA1 TaxID=3039148 RepID=UPI0037C9895A